MLRQSLPLALAATVILAPAARAQAPAKVLVNLDRHGVALQGYDPVAFFSDSQPVKGRPDFTARYQGGIYYFASAEHRRVFEAAPERYVPAFGGYCAYGVAQGHTASVQIGTWQIHDGRLLLNYSEGIRRRFDQDMTGYLARADRNWPGIVAKEGRPADP